MSDNLDLFSNFAAAPEPEPSRYPDAPAFRATDTSREAAEELAPHLGRLQVLVLGAIEAAGERGLTADETCDVLRLDRWTVQPRTSELRAKLKIRDSGQRRPNRSGKRAIVWVSANVAEAAPPARAA